MQSNMKMYNFFIFLITFYLFFIFYFFERIEIDGSVSGVVAVNALTESTFSALYYCLLTWHQLY